MRTYVGNPGPPHCVFVEFADKPSERLPLASNIVWGDATKPNTTAMAFAILEHCLQDRARAAMLATRFKWRMASHWKPMRGWFLSEQEILSVVADIEKVAAESAPMTRAIERERPAPDSDRITADMGWGGSTPRPKA